MNVISPHKLVDCCFSFDPKDSEGAEDDLLGLLELKQASSFTG